MSKVRHRIIVDLTTEKLDNIVVRQRLSLLGEVHTVSVKKIADEHVCVQRLVAGLGRQDLDTRFTQLTEMVENIQNSDLHKELDSLAVQLGKEASPEVIFPNS